MKNVIILALALLLASAVGGFAQTVIPGGDVYGTWDLAGSPYLIEGEITVPAGETLTIEPGVVVNFQGHHKMIVNGYLEANGTEEERITFTADDSVTGWHSIRFLDAPATSHISYAVIEYGRATGTVLQDKRGGGIYCENSAPDLSYILFVNNSAQWGGGIYCWSSSPSVTNCTFYGNDAGDAGGMTVVGGNPSVMNCIFWENGGFEEIMGTATVTFSDIQGGMFGPGNINDDPMFVDPAAGDFHLQEGSPCIDTGSPTSPNDPDGTPADMGAYYFPQEPLPVPFNLAATLDSLTGEVTLDWEFEGGGGGEIDTLIYDNGPTGNGYTYVGYTMSTQMSPDGPCQLLTLLYNVFVSPPGSDDEFNAEIYNWAGSQPGTDLLYQETVQADPVEVFTAVDVSGAGLSFTGDFVVGFGSLNATTFLGFDPNYNNGRSWDYDPGTQSWASWNEAYIIRAVVQYETGEIDILEPVAVQATYPAVARAAEKTAKVFDLPPQSDNTDDFIEFIVYRDDVEIGRTAETTYTDILPDYGTYSYYVTALFDEGESDPSDPVEVTWYAVGVEENRADEYPTEYSLYPAHPNPFNPVTTLSFALPVADWVSLKVFDVNGREAADLVSGRFSAGVHDVTFDASHLASGIYFYRLKAGSFQAVGKLVLMK